MARIEIASAFVEETVGNPAFVLKCAEPHSKKDDQGNWQTTSRTFFDLKASRESQIDLAQFKKGDRIKIWGTQRTEVREHEGRKYFTLTVWADRVEVAQSSQHGSSGGRASGAGVGSSGGVSSPQNADSGFGAGFDDEQPF